MDTTNKITDTDTNTNKYCTNHPSQKKAAKKYYDNNKDVIYQRLKEKLQNDPEFKKKRLEYARRSRENKKLNKLQNAQSVSS
jgi:hypothetical protein